MALRIYRKKRNFSRTPEPAGSIPAERGRHYVIQKHDATRLHYDFRLEMNGMMLSWAVPKGPCLDPAQKRLAVQVEDHPVSYRTFEGSIPAGNYGGGTVMVWDQGYWAPLGNAEQDYRDGRLKFTLHGEKLHGDWMLVRMKSRPSDRGCINWLLIKERDATAQPLSKGDVLTDLPNSVQSGRTLAEIAATKTPGRRQSFAKKAASPSAANKAPALSFKKNYTRNRTKKSSKPSAKNSRRPTRRFSQKN